MRRTELRHERGSRSETTQTGHPLPRSHAPCPRGTIPHARAPRGIPSSLGRVGAVILLTAVWLFASAPGGFAITADEVARRMDERGEGKDARIEMTMALIDSRGRRTERALFLVRRTFEEGDRMLLRFTKPGDIRGTSFLVREHDAPGEDDERFLYLPALGRSRRITSSEKTDSFAGTDFTYEDISGRRIGDFTYRLLGDSTLATGERCLRLESTPRNEEEAYARTVSLVDTLTWLPRGVDYLDRRGRVVRRFELVRRERIDGIWTMTEMVMTDLEHDHRTRIIVTEARYDRGVEARLFTRRELERGIP